MSNSYRITQSQSVTREVRSEDSITVPLRLLELLDAGRLSQLVQEELASRGYEEGVKDAGDGISIVFDTCAGTVTMQGAKKQTVTVKGKATSYQDDDFVPNNPKDGRYREAQKKVTEKAELDAEKRLADEAEKQRKQITKRLESKLDAMRTEVAAVVEAVTKRAMLEKARAMGNIMETLEDGNGGMTIRVEV